MPLDLKKPLDWKKPDPDAAVMLSELQANILKAHVRDHLSVLFFRFTNRADGKAFLRSTAPLVKSALQHLQEAELFDRFKIPGSVYVGVGLSQTGYAALGLGAKSPPDPSFRKGMKTQGKPTTKLPPLNISMNDPPPASWDSAYQGDIHCVVLIGDAENRASAVAATRNQLLAAKPASVILLGEEHGLSQTRTISNGDKVGIEHFGYMDGRSQPLFLTDQIAAEPKAKWDPAFGLEQVITPDAAAPGPTTGQKPPLFGSYFIFRKLEQNVRAFKKAEERLADSLGLTGDDRERAGAMVVGRFEDGSPVTMQKTDGIAPVANDFNYSADAQGLKCPLHGHIRKTNPRGSGGAEAQIDERKHLMARRGQTYGVRTDDPTDDSPPSKRPTGGVGLLFMAFNTVIGNQFEFTQATWANNPNFPVSGPPTRGPDDVIAQASRTKQSYAKAWGTGPKIEGSDFAQAVTLKGGEYFFMPCLAFLRTI